MLKNYLKITIKILMRHKFYTFISLFGISFTLMVLMVFTAFYENLFGNLPPESNCDRMLRISEVQFGKEGGGSRTASPGYVMLEEYIKVHSLPHIELASISSDHFRVVELVFNNQTFKVYQKRTDGNFWKILDFSFIEGRSLTEDDEKEARNVAVINETTKKKLFGKKSALNEMINIDGRQFRIIGVVKDVTIFRSIPFADVWVPISTAKTNAYLHDGIFGGFGAIILAKKRSKIPLIKEEYQRRLQRMDYPAPKPYTWVKGRAETHLEFESRQALKKDGDHLDKEYKYTFGMVLAIAILLFILIPTINLININLSRILERSSEIGVRRAFGASSRVLVSQFIIENILLTLCGGIIGFCLSTGLLQLINTSRLIPHTNFQFNVPIFVYGFIFTLLFGVISGVYPAWKMSRLHPVTALRQGPMLSSTSR